MKTIALRFADNYAPKEGTIKLHQEIINNNGYVWYGKFGNTLSQKNIDLLMSQPNKKILLIKSGFPDRYWASFEEINRDKPLDIDNIPEYYRNNTDKIKCWFKITKFERAENNVMSKFIISSSKMPLSEASKHSLNPYFVIETGGDHNE
jgi:hypothetical protein